MNGGFEFLCSNVLAKETEIPVFPFLSCVSLSELEPFQGFLTGLSVPSAAAWLKLRPKPWLKQPLQLPRYRSQVTLYLHNEELCAVFWTYLLLDVEHFPSQMGRWLSGFLFPSK